MMKGYDRTHWIQAPSYNVRDDDGDKGPPDREGKRGVYHGWVKLLYGRRLRCDKGGLRVMKLAKGVLILSSTILNAVSEHQRSGTMTLIAGAFGRSLFSFYAENRLRSYDNIQLPL